MDKKNNIMEKVSRRNFYLSEVKANRIITSPKEGKTNIHQEMDYEILENNIDRVKIKILVSTAMEPEDVFKINLEYILDLYCNTPISNQEINDNINRLVGIIGNEASYTVGFLTKQMVNYTVILPPATIK